MMQGNIVWGKFVGLWLLVLVMATAAVGSEQAVPLDKNGLPMWVVKEWADFPIEMTLDNHEALEQLLKVVPIASFHREQFSVHFDSPKDFHLVFQPRVTAEEAEALAEAGYDFRRIRDLDREGREATEKRWAEMAAKGGDVFKYGERGTYPTHAQIGATFAQMAADHPDLCRDFVMGSSIQGREQWGLVISNNVQSSEAEPEVMLSSTMHGDEVCGMFLLFEFAQYMMDHYQEAGYEDITYLVDNFEIHFIPDYNPDGTALDQRGNANGTDLNRNFPEPTGPAVTEQENVNFMNYVTGKHFVASWNYHGGALVVNYPYDHTYSLAPDDLAFIQHSLAYSTTNLPMYNGAWPQGITNGADWYRIDGGLQDWHYYTQNSMAVTVEVSDIKWPPESALDGFWDDNRESIINWVKAVKYGVNGLISGADTGQPLDATVTISGISTPAMVDPMHGDYYKLLDTGTYDLTFEADGYITQTVYNVAVIWGQTTLLDVVMQPVAHGEVSGVVEDLSGNGLEAQVNVYTVPTAQYVTSVNSSAIDGSYLASLVYGDYELRVVKSGYVTQTATVTIGETPQVRNFVLGQAEEVVLFGDDFESGLAGWTGGWGLADPAEGYNSANCLNDSPGGDYEDSATNIMTMASSVDLTGAMSGELSFRAKWEIEDTWDACFLEVSTDGGLLWIPVATQHTQAASGQGGQVPSGAPCFDDSQSNWVINTVNLVSYLGENELLFRFRISSDTSVNHSGFFVDDFELMVVREQLVTPVPGADLLVAAVRAWPNPFNPQTAVEFTNPRSGKVSLAIYDLQGRLVRSLVSENLTAGAHTRVWDGRTDSGNLSASGVYFARMIAGQQLATTKLMLLK